MSINFKLTDNVDDIKDRLFGDYPDNLTPDEKEIFDKKNPFWKEFFGK